MQSRNRDGRHEQHENTDERHAHERAKLTSRSGHGVALFAGRATRAENVQEYGEGHRRGEEGGEDHLELQSKTGFVLSAPQHWVKPSAQIAGDPPSDAQRAPGRCVARQS